MSSGAGEEVSPAPPACSLRVIVNVAVLGLSCALNPVLLGVVMLTLASDRPKGMLGAYLAGAITWSIGIGIGAVATSAEVFKPHSSRTASPVFDIVVGALLLAGALLYATGRAQRWRARRIAQVKARKAARAEAKNAARVAAKQPVPAGARAGGEAAAGFTSSEQPAEQPDAEQPRPSLSQRLLSGSPGPAFAAGVVMNFPSLRYIEALKEITAADVAERQQILAVVLFNLLMLSPAIVPLTLLYVRPEETRAIVTRLDTAMRVHARALISGALGCIGLYLIGKGILGLT